MTLDGGVGCIAESRRHTERFLTRAQVEHGVPVSERAHDVSKLVVSELVTNACKYAPGPIGLRLRVVGTQVELSVQDREILLPAPRGADPDRVGRHGLEIVLAVTESFAVTREPRGKRVTVRIALTDDAAAR
ncbi:ATP-binding protein [Streptomyces sp. LP11]|uniref:ATP-binding protein n=1 Tax=Streptomyces pyxinicus TaxID=2970331 RepID=A0ABT2B3D3_9ACTN|nr:ATP-binding protein [Streptomyces sp. LP11]